MAKNWILGTSNSNFWFSILFVYLIGNRFLHQVQSDDSFTVSSFTYSKTVLKPYEWRYIRVDLPAWFSSLSIALDSDVDIHYDSFQEISTSSSPIICLREGSPPVPDVYNTSIALGSISNITFGGTWGLQNGELCYPMQKNITMKFTNEQISPGIWYMGIFNGIGPMRTRSKMINRGPTCSYSGNVIVEGCRTSTLWGQYCNRTVDALSCVESYNNLNSSVTELNQTAPNVVSCENSNENTCHEGPKIYSLDVTGITEQFRVTASNVKLSSSNDTDIVMMCYARFGAIPSASLHDFSGNISKAEALVIRSPKVGRWYILVQPVDMIRKVCYSLEWKVLQCPIDKAGSNCSWEIYMLQTVLRKNSVNSFESSYIPITAKVSSGSSNFRLEPLLSNSTNGNDSNFAWTYFNLDVPYAVAGGNIHVTLKADTSIVYEIYARYGGLPSLDIWDYFYVNATSNSNGSMFFKLYESSEDSISFYVVYARGGTWSFGLRHRSSTEHQTTMSISLERCPSKCSSHGSCHSDFEASGLALYSYCFCDRDHGGFDCGVEMVSHRGHVWQSVCLIASNVVAVLPAYWALRQKAYAEWIIFTTSGISSALYHACDVGTWCALTFQTLQFMDFWLSFMAVVSTFVYLASLDEGSKRTIHTAVAIFTALMAQTGPTKSSNIVLVIAIGVSGLVMGWLIEFCSNYRSFSFSTGFSLHVLYRWETVKLWVQDHVKKLLKLFRWGFVVGGFCGLAMAAISWNLETTETYWIWHSMWHVSIYSSSFLFLCSRTNSSGTGENPRPIPDAVNYQLARQDPSPRAQTA